MSLNISRRGGTKGLDELKEKNEQGKLVPAMHIRFTPKQRPKLFCFFGKKFLYTRGFSAESAAADVMHAEMPGGEVSKAEIEEVKRHVAAIAKTVRSLVELPFKNFWCTFVFLEDVRKFYLWFVRYYFRAWWNAPKESYCGKLMEELRECDAELRTSMKQFFVRLCTRQESGSVFLSKGGYVEFVRKNGVFSAVNLLNAFAMFGPVDDGVALAQVVRDLLLDVTDLKDELLREMARLAPKIAENFVLDEEILSGRDGEALARYFNYMIDCCATLNGFFKCVPLSAAAFRETDALTNIVGLYNFVGREASKGNKQFCCEEVEHLMSLLLSSATYIFVEIMCHPFDDALAKPTSSDADTMVTFLMTAVGDVGPFAEDFGAHLDCKERLKRYQQEHPDLFDKSTVESLVSAFGGADAQAEEFECETDLSRSIEQIMDLFPDSDFDKVQSALERSGNKVELVVSGILDETINVSRETGKLDMHVGKRETEATETEPDLKDFTMRRLEVMEEEEEREMYRRMDARLKAQQDGASFTDAYDDEYDDSFDDFVRFGIQQEGEALADPNKREVVERDPSPKLDVKKASSAKPFVPAVRSQKDIARERDASKRGRQNYRRERGFNKRQPKA